MDTSKNESQEHLLKYPAQCYKRPDDVGLWNVFKAWYWYPLHLLSCTAFVLLMLLSIDGQYFMMGTPPNVFFWSKDRGIYQIEITGFVSTILVILRLLASCGAALLIWRLIYLLLEKSGLSLAEICRMANLKVPITPHLKGRKHFHWSCVAITTTLLLWPSSIAAPLANSSLEWTAASRLAKRHTLPYNFTTVNQSNVDWGLLEYEHAIIPAVMSASLMISQDPDYAFTALNHSRVPLRRYIHGPSRYINASGEASVSLPYFEVKDIKWLDAPSGLRGKLHKLSNASMLESGKSLNPELFARPGMMGFLQKTKWNYTEAKMRYNSSAAKTFEVKRNISIYLGENNIASPLKNGTIPTQQTPCPLHGDLFEKLPPVKQEYTDVFLGSEWRARRCYMLAEITMRAGIYPTRRVNITLPGSIGTNIVDAVEPPDLSPNLQRDNAILPVFDMMSDVAGMMTTMELVSRWHKDIDLYVKGTLTSAYISTWSAFPLVENKTLSLTPFEDVIQATVNRTRLYIWLGMNSTLAIAALITAICGITAKTKTVRDTTLAAITLDIRHLAHVNKDGLCNAVSLDKADRKLKRLKWRDATDLELSQMGGDDKKCTCYKELVIT